MLPTNLKQDAMQQFMTDYQICVEDSRNMNLTEAERTIAAKKALAYACGIVTLDGALNGVGERRNVPVVFKDLPFEGPMTPCILLSVMDLITIAQKAGDTCTSQHDMVNLVAFAGTTEAFLITPENVGNMQLFKKDNI